LESTPLLALPVVLAIETGAGAATRRTTFSRDEAAELAAHVAADLQRLVPAATDARLALVGALFDTVELLRPGFPVWATLDELARRVPRGHLENVVAFGTHDGHMPAQPLEPDPAYADGPMRLLPITLLAPESLAEELGEQLERELVGRGEAGQRTADWLIRTLDMPLEHVRYLSRDDLLALTCVQYEHVNLAPLWNLLEAALLTPYREEATSSARGLPLRYAEGIVYAQSPAQWLAASHETDRAHAFAGIVFELRQYAALLDAHALPLRLAPDAAIATEAGDGFLLEVLAGPEAGYGDPLLVAHEAAGLGVVAVTAAQRGEGGRARVLAHGYPLQPRALGALVTALAARFDVAADLHALGRIQLDANGALGAPDTPLH
jgi:hypothetical protein